MNIKNFNIITLYISVFIIVSLMTTYLPLWLKNYFLLELDEIGFLISSIGVTKLFSNYIIVNKIRNINNLKIIIISIIAFFIVFFLIIFLYSEKISRSMNLLLIFLSLLIFSPILPMIETIFNNKKIPFQKEYGKIRLNGSLSFLFTVLLAGLFFESFSLTYFPILVLLALLFFLINALQIKKEKKNWKKVTYNNSIKKLLYSKEYVLILVTCCLVQSSHAMYYSFSSIFWNRTGLSISEIGNLWAIGVIAEIILFYKLNNIDIKRNFYFLINLCCILTSFRWIATFLTDNYFLLIIIQFFHAVSFGLTHYLMMYFINSKVPSELRLISQVCYHGLSSGIFLTIFIFLLGIYSSYFNDNKGYLFMAIICILSLLISILAKKDYDKKKY